MENKEKARDRIMEFVDVVLERAAEQGNFDYFNIEIIKHESTLQMDYKIRTREKI